MNKENKFRDYFFFCVDGVGGTGKTVLLTALAHLTAKSYKTVYANFTIKGLDNFRLIRGELNKQQILSLDVDSLLLLTEAYIYFDCRESQKKNNIQRTHAFFQARKKGMDIFFDIPSFNYAELRLKEWTKLIFSAKGCLKNNPNIFVYDIGMYSAKYDFVYPIAQNKKLNMENVFQFFDSYEIIDTKRGLGGWN